MTSKVAVALVLVSFSRLSAQTPDSSLSMPATKLEAFKPRAGTIVTVGYASFLSAPRGMSISVREYHAPDSSPTRGVVVQLSNTVSNETAFIDADELPELIDGIDALLAISRNPTKYPNFWVEYSTKGGLHLFAFGGISAVGIKYEVQAGRVTRITNDLSLSGMKSLRAIFADAASALNVPADK